MVSISIKSEIDSRVALYPLMRCVAPLGNCLLVTSNRQVSRLIDNEYEGDFRNFHIMVDVDGGTDELLQDAGIEIQSYSYIIYDNVGVVEQDKLLIPIGPIISEAFESEMMYLGEDKDTHIIRFGKAISKKPSSAPKKIEGEENKKQKKQPVSKPIPTEEDIDDAAKRKFQAKKEDITEKLKKLPNMQFPSFEFMELFESDHKFQEIDRNFVKFFYTVFQDYIGLKEPNYIQEVTRKDAGSSSFTQRPSNG